MRRVAVLAVTIASLLPAAAAQAGPFVYVTNTGTDEISQYDSAPTGLLAPLVPPSVHQTFPLGVATSPDGRSVYVSSGFPDQAIYQYDVGPSGALTPKRPPTVSADAGGSYALIVSRDGDSLYASGNERVLQFDIGATGALTPKAPASAPASFGPNAFAQTSDGSSLYVANFSAGLISQYDVGSTGALTPKDPALVNTGGSSPQAIAVSPDDRSVYVANRDGHPATIAQFDIGPGGALAPKDPLLVPTGDFPQGLVVSRDGRSVYAAVAVQALVSQYDVGQNGALTPKATPFVGPAGQGNSMALSPDGRSVYVTDGVSNTVAQYSVGTGGALEPKQPASAPAGSYPFGIAVGPAPALPERFEQCLHRGWQQYGFKNQGQCLVFVLRTRACRLLERIGHHPGSCPPRPPRS